MSAFPGRSGLGGKSVKTKVRTYRCKTCGEDIVVLGNKGPFEAGWDHAVARHLIPGVRDLMQSTEGGVA